MYYINGSKNIIDRKKYLILIYVFNISHLEWDLNNSRRSEIHFFKGL